MPFPDRTDRPSKQADGCFAEECPEPVNIGFRKPDGTTVPYFVCNHECPEDNHGSRHYVTKNKDTVALRRIESPIVLLHVYGQDAWHGDLTIAGNLAGLEALHQAVVRAIEYAKLKMIRDEATDVVVRTTQEAMTSDGEGFSINVLLDNRPWYDPSKKNLVWDYALPYTDDMAKDQSEESRDPMGEWYICETCGKTFNEHTGEQTFINGEPERPLPPGVHLWKPRRGGDPAPDPLDDAAKEA